LPPSVKVYQQKARQQNQKLICLCLPFLLVDFDFFLLCQFFHKVLAHSASEWHASMLFVLKDMRLRDVDKSTAIFFNRISPVSWAFPVFERVV
jgi:hypothetical protein